MNPEEVSRLVNVNNQTDSAVKVRYLKALRLWAEMIRREPRNPRYYLAAAGACAHLGREHEEILYLRKGRSLIDFRKIKPDTLTAPTRSPRDIVEDRILQEMGSCCRGMAGQPRRSGKDASWYIPLALSDFAGLLKLTAAQRCAFAALRRPAAVIAFDRCIAVAECDDPDSADDLLVAPVIHHQIMKAFPVLRRRIESGGTHELESAYEFDYAVDTPPSPHFQSQTKEGPGGTSAFARPCGA
jgi:hypothetical protein